MKKLSSLSVFVFFLSSLVFAQAPIPNGSFETWTNGNPNSWGNSDAVITALPLGIQDPGTADQDTAAANVYAGTSSIRLTNKNLTLPIVGSRDVPGVVSLGKIALDLGTQMLNITGYAYTDRPDSIRFAAKFTSGPGGTDTGNVAVTLTKWTANGRVIIANSIIPVVDNPSFTLFSHKITYHSILTPDTLLIQGIATSSQSSSVMESMMWLDAMSFTGLDTAFKAYINPGRNVQMCDGDTTRFRTDDINGNTVQWYRNDLPVNGANTPSFETLTDGTYYVKVNNGGTDYTSDTIHVTVNPLPAVSFTVPANQDTLCLNSSAITLTNVAPTGGVFTGDGVDSTGHFSPTVIGNNVITYAVMNNFGCIANITQNIWVKLCTGIEVLEDGLNVNIYPNPASSFVTVETDSKLFGGSIEIYDVTGKLMTKETINGAKSNLNLGGFASGLYAIRLVNIAKKAVANAKISVAH